MINTEIAARWWVMGLLMLSLTSELLADTSIEAYYTGELLHNRQGGIASGSAYLSDAGLTLQADIPALVGGGAAIFSGTLLWNNSNRFSERYVGDLQGVSNIDTVSAIRVYEFWYEQMFRGLSLRFGLYDLNSEFDVIESASLFLNSSHGIGPDYSQSGQQGPSIFPVTALALRLQGAVGESGQLRYAILDGVPGDPNDVTRTTIELGGSDGVLHALEYNNESSQGRFSLGAWLYSADFERIEGTDMNGQPLREDGNAGIYASIDAPVYTAGAFKVNGFFRLGFANDNINPLGSYIGAGLHFTGFNSRRPSDQIGIAVAHAQAGDVYKRQFTPGIDNSETNIELTYSAKPVHWLRLQPNLQYVINPGLNPLAANALIAGLRFELSYSK